jgi:hypothetical protein
MLGDPDGQPVAAALGQNRGTDWSVVLSEHPSPVASARERRGAIRHPSGVRHARADCRRIGEARHAEGTAADA